METEINLDPCFKHKQQKQRKQLEHMQSKPEVDPRLWWYILSQRTSSARRTRQRVGRTRGDSPETAWRPPRWPASSGLGPSAATGENINKQTHDQYRLRDWDQYWNRKDLQDKYLNGCENGGNIINGAPLVLQNIEADCTISVNIGVKHLGDKLHFWRLVRVVLGEAELELEGATFPRCVVRTERWKFRAFLGFCERWRVIIHRK